MAENNSQNKKTNSLQKTVELPTKNTIKSDFLVLPLTSITKNENQTERLSVQNTKEYTTKTSVQKKNLAISSIHTMTFWGEAPIEKTANTTVKSITRLFVGSEGTLGVITEISLRLHGLCESISAAIVNFPDVRSAAEATIMTIQMGIPVARIEILDSAYIKAINAYSKTDYPELDTLFLEFHGTSAGVAEQVQMFDEISQEFGATGFQWAEKEEDRNKLWRARHDAYYAGLAVRPGYRGYVTDVCVPISRLADCIAETQADIAASGLFAPVIGHVGDGNFHSTMFIDPDDDAMFEKALEIDKRMVQRAIDMGGTCTGEHGIGMGKLKHMRNEHGDGAVETMQAIKRALDPQNIMNPGKVVDC